MIAYIGPGAGLAAIAIFFAVLAAVLVAFIGFLWYPLRRLIRKIRATRRGR
jgi:flagellar biogenesis protein FliO